MLDEILFYGEKKIDFHLIEETFRLSFNQEIDKKTWDWRFLSNPHDHIHINYI